MSFSASVLLVAASCVPSFSSAVAAGPHAFDSPGLRRYARAVCTIRRHLCRRNFSHPWFVYAWCETL